MFAFFDGKYRRMSREDRKQVFGVYFKWNRRKSFVLFLAGEGYIYIVGMTGDDERRRFICDNIFDVEDMDRVICSFL